MLSYVGEACPERSLERDEAIRASLGQEHPSGSRFEGRIEAGDTGSGIAVVLTASWM